jgi:5-methylcytosine-specific restriction enzyme A
MHPCGHVAGVDHRCPARRARAPRVAAYTTTAWRKLSRRQIGSWVAARGSWCPGFARPGHPSNDLTLDHIVSMSQGGAPYDVRNTQVLCRSCNVRKRHVTNPDRGKPKVRRG